MSSQPPPRARAVRRTVPDKYRHFVPDTVLIGLAQFPPANAFSATVGLGMALLFQVYLKRMQPAWYNKYQMVSTTGMNTGVGIGGLALLAIQSLGLNHGVDLGGAVRDGCIGYPRMPQF